MSLRGTVITLTPEVRSAEFDETGRTDGRVEGPEKCLLDVFILFVYVDKVYTYLYTKGNSHQHCYGFQNLMSSWGSGSKFSNLQQVGDFSILDSKSVIFYIAEGF